jgi:hypothetical protein
MLPSVAAVTLPDFSEGERAVKAVRGAGIPLRYAFWGYFGDSREYRLVLPTDTVERRGPIAVYADIQKALSANKVKIPLSLITLARYAEPLGQLGLNALHMAKPFTTTSTGGGSLVSNEALGVTVDTRHVYP